VNTSKKEKEAVESNRKKKWRKGDGVVYGERRGASLREKKEEKGQKRSLTLKRKVREIHTSWAGEKN